MAKKFVNGEVIGEAIIAFPWRGRARKKGRVRAAVRQSALGYGQLLRAKDDRVDEGDPIGGEQCDGLALFIQNKIDVIATLAGIVVRNPFYKP